MTIWFAGGGVNAGHTIGATDETGAEAVECVHHVRDLHVTLLKSARPGRQQAHLFPRRPIQAAFAVWRKGDQGIDRLIRWTVPDARVVSFSVILAFVGQASA